jgi:N-acetylglucosamine kinase-like BadF-type ATPase
MDLVTVVYGGGRDRAALAALAPLVLDVAESGDAVAAQIVGEAAEDLARAVAAVARALDLSVSHLPVALTGGTLLGSASYRGAVLRAMTRRGIAADPVQFVQEPAEGGVILANRTTARTRG